MFRTPFASVVIGMTRGASVFSSSSRLLSAPATLRVRVLDEEEHVAEEGHHDIHMPDPSYFPFLAALGLPVIMYGLIYFWPASIVGALITMAGLFGWSLEPVAED